MSIASRQRNRQGSSRETSSPGPYKHPIRQKVFGLFQGPANKTKGAFGGVSIPKRIALRKAREATEKAAA